MSTSYAIFVNPDTTSDIYTLLHTQANASSGTASVTTTDTEISLDELETAILAVPNANDIVFLLHPNYATSMSDTQLDDLQDYLHNIFVTNVVDDVDIFYLTNFMDNCLNRVELDVQPIDSISNVSVTFSTAPNGIGCVATTKTKWQNIIALAKGQDEKNVSAKLSGLVIGEEIIAATSQPLFVFPDLNKQTDALDALKTQYCRIEKNFGRAVPNTENMSFFWFVLGVSVIVFVAWVLSYYMPKNKVMLMKKY
jgi:hypothetical protein